LFILQNPSNHRYLCNKADSQWHYALADQHQLMAGVVFDHLRAVPRTTDLSQPYDPNLSVEQQHLYYLGTNNSLPVKIFQVTQDNLGVFLQDQYQWSSQLSSQIGIRFDDNSDYKASTSPYLGLKYNYTPETTFSLTYSQAYLAPSPSYSYEHFGSFTGQQDNQGRYLADTFRVPNPDLQPETAKAVELIINQELNEHWQLISTAYGSHLQNLILFASPTANPVSEFINGGWIKNTDHNVNLGESVAYGVELSSRYRQQHYELWGHYSFTDGHLSTNKGEEELPYNAKHKLKLGATWRHKQGWFISPSLYFVGQNRVPSSASDGSRAVTVPSYQLFNMYAGYPQIVQGVDVFMCIENIASSKYCHAGGL
ncbi:MAG TPA: TonB-dependent receptor, partial [Agitococcus sp.]|nr:TonB-dependent receptor [Agitococcus sp.]